MTLPHLPVTRLVLGRCCATSARPTPPSGSRPTAPAPSRCSAAPSAPGGGRHHYALVVVERAAAGTPRRRTTYGWTARSSGPPPDSDLPAPRIRTMDPEHAAPRRLRVVPLRDARTRSRATTTSRRTRWTRTPADGAGCPTTGGRTRCSCSATRSTPTRRPSTSSARIRARRDVDVEPGEQIKDFEEYTWLYEESWTDPHVRWLLSTIPSSMIFDDHDVADDWNTSSAVAAATCSRRRGGRSAIVGALSSYWVYQHLGNLSPQDLADDELYQRVRDARRRLRAAAARVRDRGRQGGGRRARARSGPTGATSATSGCWSSTRGAGGCSTPTTARWCPTRSSAGSRSRSTATTTTCWSAPRCRGCWRAPCTTSRPGTRCWPPARAGRGWRAGPRSSGGRRPRALGGVPAVLRPARRSCSPSVGRGEHAGPAAARPATICVLSGDVHHAYAARADYRRASVTVAGLPADLLAGAQLRAAVMKVAFRISWTPGRRALHALPAQRRLARPAAAAVAGTGSPARTTATRSRPCSCDGRSAAAGHRAGRRRRDGRARLTPVVDLALADRGGRGPASWPGCEQPAACTPRTRPGCSSRRPRVRRWRPLVVRRVAGEPLEQVLGWASFGGLRVAVVPGVFVPRRRTELLVREAVAVTTPDAVVVDLCCGCGAVGLAVATTVPGVELHAADVDPVAVACARDNLAGLGVVGGTVHLGDLDALAAARLRGRVDVLAANAPYVPTAEIALMPPEARDHEPPVALDGGADGLDVARRVVAAAWLAGARRPCPGRDQPAAGAVAGRRRHRGRPGAAGRDRRRPRRHRGHRPARLTPPARPLLITDVILPPTGDCRDRGDHGSGLTERRGLGLDRLPFEVLLSKDVYRAMPGPRTRCRSRGTWTATRTPCARWPTRCGCGCSRS